MATKTAAPAAAKATSPAKPAAAPTPAAKPAAAPAAQAAPAKAANGPGGQGRKVMLPTGEARVDYIKRRYAEGIKRGDIARELSEITGVKVPYQIVFAATKPQKAEASAEAEE